MKEVSTKIIAIVASLLTTAILGGFSFIKEVESRLAIIEDDLGETVEVVGLLHPPQRAEVFKNSDIAYTDSKDKKRKEILDRLKKQAEEKKKKKKEDEKNDSQLNVTFH